MPREYVLQTASAVGLAEILVAANAVDANFGIRGIGGTDTLQIYRSDESPLVTFLPSTQLDRGVDSKTLAENAEHDMFWTEAFVPWDAADDLPVRMLTQLAEICGGRLDGAEAPTLERRP